MGLGVCFLLCVYFIEIKGSSSQTRFIQTNTDLQLTVTEEVQIGRDIFHWRFNNSKNIIRLLRDEVDHSDDYENRVEFFKQNLSLILKNVQLSDSGIYTAVVSRKIEEILSTFDVTVQAPVSPVLVKENSVSNNSESCNFTVSCTTEHSSINRSFTCDRHTCVEAHPPTPGPSSSSDLTSSLQLSLTSETIVCNHSNQVSWTQDTKNYRQICPKATKEETVGQSKNHLTPVLIAVAIIVLGGLAIFFVARRRQTCRRIIVENTVYEVPQCTSVEPAPAPESPNTIYSEVQPHTAPPPATSQNPESLYATVNKTSTPDLLSQA